MQLRGAYLIHRFLYNKKTYLPLTRFYKFNRKIQAMKKNIKYKNPLDELTLNTVKNKSS